MIYYKLTDMNENELGFITSSDFRFYHPGRKRMFLTTKLEEMQYVIFNGEYYRIPWFVKEDESMRGTYSEAQIFLSTKEDYEKYIAQEEEAIADEK